MQTKRQAKMHPKYNLSGQVIGSLTIKEYVGNSKWNCYCSKCGVYKKVNTCTLTKLKSSGKDGCTHARMISPGDWFGNLRVEKQGDDYIKPKSQKHERRWQCICVCGRNKLVLESNLKAYKSLSCGLCSNRISIPEKAILFYLSKSIPDIEENYRPRFLKGKELDLYIPSLSLGIEYDGEHWHKSLDKDINKTRICNENNITVVRIREPGCPYSEAIGPCITTPKPTTNGTHMTQPIVQLIEWINMNYSLHLSTDVDCVRDNADIGKTNINSTKNNSLSVMFPLISKEWDYDKNYPLTPDRVAAHSGRKAWWLCSRGHSFSSVIASRTGGDKTGCPICNNKGSALYRNGEYLGSHSLAKERPDIAEEFDSIKNGILPDNIAVSSNRKMWFKCKKCGFEWKSKVNNRTSSLNTGCPDCAKRENKSTITRRKNDVMKKGSLMQLYPELCKEWDYEKNSISPSEITKGSSLKVWWKCNLGHCYKASINKRTGSESTGCPICNAKYKYIVDGQMELEL